MNKVRQGLDNQAIGLLPLMTFMFLDIFFPYKLSFLIGATFCLSSLVIYYLLSHRQVYQLMLLPTAVTFIGYSLFLGMHLEPVLFTYSPLIVELILVVVLILMNLFKGKLLQRIRESHMPKYKRSALRTTLNEFFFVAQLTQNLYTLHLFLILFYSILPEEMQNDTLHQFLYRELGFLIGFTLVLYEQLRLVLMQGSLKKEMWLPVLNESGKVVGCIARSVSRILPKKYFHPVVRIAILYKNMFYLTKRPHDDFVSPDGLDYPLHGYVLFRHTIQETVLDLIDELNLPQKEIAEPHFLVRYIFENERVKHLVSLYVLRIDSEAYLKKSDFPAGKFWIPQQIEAELPNGIFSCYFEKEYDYLKNTLLMAEQFLQVDTP
ncbi:MAG: hypothetical protein ACI30I_01925 [Parabacteroides sp.]